MLADPLNNSNDYRDIIAMFDEMMEAHAPLLPQFYPGEALPLPAEKPEIASGLVAV